MKKEGTGNPQNPDIALDAEVRMRELYFEEVPDPEVRFRGSTRRNSVWRSRRENLPDEVREGVIYRNAGVRLRIASEIVDNGPDFLVRPDKERVKSGQENTGQEVREQEPESKKEEK